MPPLVALALQFAPDIAKALAGDQASKVAASVGDAVAQAAGATDAQAAQIALAQDPAKLADLRIRLAEIAASVEKDRRAADLAALKAELADTQSARATFVDLAKSGSLLGWGPVIVSAIVTVGFFAILAWLLTLGQSLADGGQVFQLVNITIGALTAAFATVVNFWLGSSHGSRLKDNISASLQAQTAEIQSRQTTETLKTYDARVGAALGAARGPAAPEQASLAPAPAAPAPLRAAVLQAAPSPAPVAPPAAPAPAPAQPSNFDACVAIVLRSEGGYANDPRDPGGATNMGITLATLRAWRKDDSLTADDVKALTVAEARAIYRSEYWNKMRCDALPRGVDLCVFDFGVNAGPARSARLLQSLVGVAQDGAIGPITLAAVAGKPPADLIRAFADGRLAYYRSLPGFDAFGAGWTNRTNAVEASALAMAGAG